MTNEESAPPPIPAMILPSSDDDFNGWADFYFYEWGVNVIPAPTLDKGKDVKDRQFSWIDSWDEFQTRAMTKGTRRFQTQR